MAFLQAFTDDSAAQAGDRRLFFAGYMHRADVWADFSDAWDAELRGWPAIEYFKAKEANNLDGQFHHEKGWDEAKRDAKVGNLAAIIRHFEPYSFEFSVNRRLIEDELKPVSPRGFGSAHFHMCYAVCAGVARMASQSGITTPIEFIFDEQDGVDTDIAMFFSDIMKGLPAEARDLIDGPPVFKNDKDKRYMPLQAADFLAWHVRREHETGERLLRTNDLTNRHAHLISEIPDDMVRGWIAHHSQQPGVHLVQSKGQWRKFKEEVRHLRSLGIDPSKIDKPGIYYPEGTPAIARFIDKLLRFFGRR